MVVIRLARGGAKKSPFYHIVAQDKRCARDGRFIEKLGYFNPLARGSDVRINLDRERFDYWCERGAQPSDRVAELFKSFARGDTAPRAKPTKHITPPKAANASSEAESNASDKKSDEA